MARYKDIIDRTKKRQSFYPVNENDLTEEPQSGNQAQPDTSKAVVEQVLNKQGTSVEQMSGIVDTQRNSFYPFDEQKPGADLHTTFSASSNNGVTSTNSNNQAQKYKNKPESLTDSEYERLLKFYPESTISKHFNQSYDPNDNEGIFARIFSSTIEKPKELDENKIKNAKILGSISDAAGLVIQMMSGSRGAHISRRDIDKSASAQLAKEEKDLRKLYMAKMDKYNNQLLNVKFKDFLHGYNKHDEISKNMHNILLQNEKLQNDREKFDINMQFKQGNEDWNRSYKLLQEKNKQGDREVKHKDIEHQQKDREERRRIDWAKLALAKKRTSAYIRRWGNGKTGGYEMRIDAVPEDKQAVLDEFELPVRIYNLTKEQVDHYAQKAISQPGFAEKHPELITVDFLTGKPTFTAKDRLARAYIQDWYDDKQNEGKELDLNTGIAADYETKTLKALTNLLSGKGGTFKPKLNESDEYENESYYFDIEE